jgi:hypothetical protein
MYDTFQYYRSVSCLLFMIGADWVVKGFCRAGKRYSIDVGRLRYIALLGRISEDLLMYLRVGRVLLISAILTVTNENGYGSDPL